MKKVLALGILTIIFIVATVYLRINMDNMELEYTKVEAEVVSSETVQKGVKSKYSTSNITEYDIVVRYEGKDYDLKNAHNSYSYREGSKVTVYMANGKMYANEEGVRTSSPMGIAYFVGLIGSFILFIVTLCVWGQVAQNKKRNAKQS